MSPRQRPERSRIETRTRISMNRDIDRAIKPYLTSTDAQDQIIGQQLSIQADRLKQRLETFRLQTAIERADAFISAVNGLSADRQRYMTAAQEYTDARQAYETTARNSGLPLSLPSEQTRPDSVTSKKRTRRLFSAEQKGAMKRDALSVYDTLASQPEYQDRVPLGKVAEGLVVQLLGRYDGNHVKVLSMMIANKPESYGFDKTSGADNKTYVSRRLPTVA